MKILHDNNDSKTNHQANHTSSTTLDDRIKELDLSHEQGETNIEQIYRNQETIAREAK